MQRWLMCCQLTLLLALFFTLPARAQDAPNFLLIVTDDMGYTDLGAFGGTHIPTPNLDRLARSGIRFTNFHAAPSCAPTRAMLMSGTGNHEAGMGSQLFNALFEGEYGYERFLQTRVATMPEVLLEGGYQTMMSGKWHIGEGDPDGGTLPREHGFARDYTLLRGADSHYDSVPLATYSDDGNVIRLENPEYSTIRYTDKLLGFLADHEDSEEPFFAVYAPTAPHWPLQYPPGWEDRFTGAFDDGFDALCLARMTGAARENVLPANAPTSSCNKESGPWSELSAADKQHYAKLMEIYAAMAAHMDESIGQILDFMETRGMLENTWVIYMNDNGPQGGGITARMVGGVTEGSFDNAYDNLGQPTSWASVGQGWADATNSPFRQTKGFQFEGGIRVAAFAWHKNLATPGRIENQFLTVMDMMPTVLDLAGVPLPGSTFNGRTVLPVRGKSFAPLLSSPDNLIHDREEGIALDSAGNRMMIKGDWKIVQLPRRDWLLFNIADDPSESTDLAAREPARLAAMVAEFNTYAQARNYIEVNTTINQP